MEKTRQDTFSRLKEILLSKLFVERGLRYGKVGLTPQTRLCKDLQMDSLDRCEFGYYTEKIFDIIIPDEKMDGFRTIGDYITYIESHPDSKR